MFRKLLGAVVLLFSFATAVPAMAEGLSWQRVGHGRIFNNDALGDNLDRWQTGGVICFTPGTMIRTPTGLLPVEMLQEGDKVQTKDNGPQEILWIGSRRMTGARLFAMPKLRPVRIRPAALGRGQPDAELLVSPEHRMLLEGPEAVALFNTPEVLVAAKDMVNGSTVTVDHLLREVTYIHLLLPAHQILWANGIETESFHPSNASLSTLGDDDRQRLLKQFPTLEYDPHSFGNYARRNLNT